LIRFYVNAVAKTNNAYKAPRHSESESESESEVGPKLETVVHTESMAKTHRKTASQKSNKYIIKRLPQKCGALFKLV